MVLSTTWSKFHVVLEPLDTTIVVASAFLRYTQQFVKVEAGEMIAGCVLQFEKFYQTSIFTLTNNKVFKNLFQERIMGGFGRGRNRQRVVVIIVVIFPIQICVNLESNKKLRK